MSLARDVTTVGTATLISRLLGYVRDAGIASVLGAGALSDAYFAALQVPNLFRRLLAEGALNAAYVPQALRMRQEGGDAAVRRFGEDVLGTTAVALCALAILAALFAPAVVHLLAPGFGPTDERLRLAVDFLRLSAPYIALSGAVAVAASALNAEGRVMAPAAGVVVFNAVLVCAVLALILADAQATPGAAALLSAAVALAGAVQLACVGAAWLRLDTGPRRFSIALTPQLRRFFAKAGPGVVAGGIPQLKLMAGAMVASSSPAAVSWLYYANRLYELPLGVISIAIAAVLGPAIAASLRTRTAARAAQAQALEIALGLALPSAIAFAVLAPDIAGALFQRGAFGPHDTAMVAAALAAMSAGLPGHALEKVFGAVSFAHEDTRTPMMAALCGLVTAGTGAMILFPHYGHVGIAAAIALSGWVGASLLGIILWRRGWLRIAAATRRRLWRIVLAAVVMGGMVAGGDAALAAWLGEPGTLVGRMAKLSLLVAIGLGTDMLCLKAFGVASARGLVAAVAKRF